MTAANDLKKHRFGGLKHLIIWTLFFALCFGSPVWWFFSDSDIEAVKGKGRQSGVPTTWAEIALMPPYRIDATHINNLIRLSEGIEPFGYHHPRDSRSPPDYITAFYPISSRARHYHQQEITTDLIPLHAYCDKLPRYMSLVILNDRDHFNKLDSLRSWKRERLLLVSSDQLLSEIRHSILLSLIKELPHDKLFVGHLYYDSGIWTSITQRADEISEHKRDVIDLLTLVEQQNFLFMKKTVQGAFVRSLEGIGCPPLQNIFPTMSHETAWIYQFIYDRCGRRRALESCLSYAHEVNSFTSIYQVAEYLRQRKKLSGRLRKDNLHEWVAYALEEDYQHYLGMFIVNGLQLSLIKAQLLNQPWPIDPFDPAGGRLRRVEHDGKLLGAYSYNINEKDDHGVTPNDLYFPIHGLPPRAPEKLAEPSR
jgi:hypothetical protein